MYKGIGCEAQQTLKVGTIAWVRMMTIPNQATLSMHDTGSWGKCHVSAHGQISFSSSACIFEIAWDHARVQDK